MSDFKRINIDGEEIIETQLRGEAILSNPLLNKGTSFTQEERTELGMLGLLPYNVSTIEQQAERRYRNFLKAQDDLSKYSFLSSIQDRNEVLFYRLVVEHADEMLPYIYTPTVGDASINYSHLYTQHRGVYFSYPQKDRIDQIVENIGYEDVDVIVVTDGSRILGLGDLGAGGMCIPVGKLSLYTAFGGIHPGKTLPVFIDVGTNNEALHKDPLYIGWKHPRISGEDYYAFVDLVLKGIKKRYPKVLWQWEDFQKPYAQQLLGKYQQQICSFNDDIQGTASVALAALLSGVRATGGTLRDQRIIIVGGGAAGIGIANVIARAIELSGVSIEEARNQIAIMDLPGLLHEGIESLESFQKPFSKKKDFLEKWSVKDSQHIPLIEVVQNWKPTVLIGVSGQPNLFTKDVVESMVNGCERPLIFPLSNPTSRSEGNPADITEWTQGKAIIATGSPFPDIEWNGQKKKVTQCNNVYIFPGVGLGVIATKATAVPDDVFIIAAKTLSEASHYAEDPTKGLFPPVQELRAVSKKIGTRVAEHLIKLGLNTVNDFDAESLVERTMWFPKYAHFKAVEQPLAKKEGF